MSTQKVDCKRCRNDYEASPYCLHCLTKDGRKRYFVPIPAEEPDEYGQLRGDPTSPCVASGKRCCDDDTYPNCKACFRAWYKKETEATQKKIKRLRAKIRKLRSAIRYAAPAVKEYMHRPLDE